MHKTIAILGVLSLLASSAPVLALTAGDTMADWNKASEVDRNEALDALGPPMSSAYETEKAALRQCVDQAAGNAAHATFLIGDIVRTCISIVEDRKSDAPHTDEI